MPRLLVLHLPGADPAGPPSWDGPEAPSAVAPAVAPAIAPFLDRLRREGVWLRQGAPVPPHAPLADALGPASPAAPLAEVLAEFLAWPGLTAGVFNLPLPSSPASRPGLLFAVPRPAQARTMAALVEPPGLAQEIGDYLTGAQGHWRTPPPRPHEADAAFARQAAFARLVFDHARRLIAAHQPGLCAVGLPGLALVRALNPPESGRAGLLLRQLDHYAAGLARAARAEAVLCLLDAAGVLAWRPGLLPPGQEETLPAGGAAELAARLMGRLPGLDAAGPAPW